MSKLTDLFNKPQTVKVENKVDDKEYRANLKIAIERLARIENRPLTQYEQDLITGKAK